MLKLWFGGPSWNLRTITLQERMGEIPNLHFFANCQQRKSLASRIHIPNRKVLGKGQKMQHHLWKRRSSTGSGEKALNLVKSILRVNNEKEHVYGALDQWTAWETEFPMIAIAKALRILRKREQWLHIIQVIKWMLSKGQVVTMRMYDTLLLAFDRDGRVDEGEIFWNMILQQYARCIPRQLFSRIIFLYDHHHMHEKIIEVFGDMEELRVKPDDHIIKRVADAFEKLGQENKKQQLEKKYVKKWTYLYFNGQRVRVMIKPAHDE